MGIDPERGSAIDWLVCFRGGGARVSGVRAFRAQTQSASRRGGSWLQPIITGAVLISSLCRAFRCMTANKRDKRTNREKKIYANEA